MIRLLEGRYGVVSTRELLIYRRTVSLCVRNSSLRYVHDVLYKSLVT